MSAQHPRLGREVLDHQLADSDGVLCGKVDDVELVEEDGRLRVAALLSGTGARRHRLPAWLLPLIGGARSDAMTRVGWAEVDVLSAVIRLRRRGATLGLGVADRKAGHRLRRLPGS
jgi:hypothetical protein